MSEAKIKVKIGHIQFLGEGETDWLSDQLDKVLDRAEDLARTGLVEQSEEVKDSTVLSGQSQVSLATFLKNSNPGSEREKFLATALWLDRRSGKAGSYSTRDITKALKDAHQSRLKNASQALIDNVSQGYCEKNSDKTFFVTEAGRDAMS